MFASFEVDFDQGFLNLSLSNKYSGQLFCSNLFVSISFIVPLFFFPKRSRCYMLLLYWTSKDWLHLIHGLENAFFVIFSFCFSIASLPFLLFLWLCFCKAPLEAFCQFSPSVPFNTNPLSSNTHFLCTVLFDCVLNVPLCPNKKPSPQSSSFSPSFCLTQKKGHSLDAPPFGE